MTPSDIIRQGPAVVTGAGSGLGRALAHKLASQGIHVAILGRSLDALNETALTHPDLIHPMQCDVSDAHQTRAGLAEIATTLGPPRILINNAAIYPRRDTLDLPAEAFMQTVQTNLGGVVNCTEAALQYMIEDGIGRILNVATFADIAPLPMSSEYSTSKGAARIYTRSVIADICDRFPDIVIGDWMPGMLATQMGIPDGLAPETAAGWGASLALMHDPSLTGTTFEMNSEILSGSGLRRKLKALLTLSRPQKPRQIIPV